MFSVEKEDKANVATYFKQSEPTTYINAPLVGALGFFRGHPS